jgi:hypothetical protein
MINRSKILILAATMAGAPALATPLAGSIYDQAQIDMEVRSCLARIGTHADYEGAVQVRHEVTVSPRRGIGHRLDIRTSVYSEDGSDAIRAYATKCVVYRDNAPVRFMISERIPQPE